MLTKTFYFLINSPKYFKLSNKTDFFCKARVMFCFTKLPFYISSFEEKKNNTLVVSSGYLWSVTVIHCYFLFVFLFAFLFVFYHKKRVQMYQQIERMYKNKLDGKNIITPVPPRIWTLPGPNPLADMNPSSQIWTPHQTFLLSIVCIKFGNWLYLQAFCRFSFISQNNIPQ